MYFFTEHSLVTISHRRIGVDMSLKKTGLELASV